MAYDQKYLYHGEWLNVREMIERSGRKISYASVSRRLKNGWHAEEERKTKMLPKSMQNVIDFGEMLRLKEG